MRKEGATPQPRPFASVSGVISSAFGIGFLPAAPGTWASLATLPLGWLIAEAGGSLALAGAALIVCLIGVIASDLVVRRLGVQDPQAIVVDEVAGQLLTLSLAPLTWQGFLAAFLAFRVFDIVKPWPASWADRDLDGGLGVMMDDMFAGAYGALIVLAASWLGWL